MRGYGEAKNAERVGRYGYSKVRVMFGEREEMNLFRKLIAWATTSDYEKAVARGYDIEKSGWPPIRKPLPPAPSPPPRGNQRCGEVIRKGG